MNKLGLAAVSSLLGAGVAYSAFWFYEARQLETQFRGQLQSVSQEIAGEGVQLEYADVGMGGFPLAHTAKIRKPVVIFQEEGQKVRVSAEQLDIRTPVFGPRRYDVQLKGDITMASEGEKPQQYTIHFLTAPKLSIALDNAGQLSKLSYADTGYEMKDGGGNTIASWNASEARLAISALSDAMVGFDVMVTTSGSYGNVNVASGDPALDRLFALNRKFGKISFALEANFAGPKQWDQAENAKLSLDVRRLEMDSDLFDFSLKGTVEKTPESAMPAALMSLRIKPVQSFIDFWAEYLAATAPDAPAGPLDTHKKQEITDTLAMLSDSGALAEDEFVTTLRSDVNGHVQIGTKSLEEAWQRVQTTLAVLLAVTPAETPVEGAPVTEPAPALPPAVPQE